MLILRDSVSEDCYSEAWIKWRSQDSDAGHHGELDERVVSSGQSRGKASGQGVEDVTLKADAI